MIEIKKLLEQHKKSTHLETELVHIKRLLIARSRSSRSRRSYSGSDTPRTEAHTASQASSPASGKVFHIPTEAHASVITHQASRTPLADDAQSYVSVSPPGTMRGTPPVSTLFEAASEQPDAPRGTAPSSDAVSAHSQQPNT